MRKLPVYILIDTSESMAGEAINSVQKGLDMMLATLRRNPHALETVWMSVITFDARAKVTVPLTEIGNFMLPTLNVKPGTSLGAALRLLAERIKREVQQTTIEKKGDWRPIVFLMTDGQPTDAWEEAAAALKNIKPKLASIYGIGCGQDIDGNVLHQISDVAYYLRELSSDMIGKFFVWMTASVQSMSQGDAPVSLDKSPFGRDCGFEEINENNLPEPHDIPFQAFIHSRCIRTRKFYMLRYVYQDEYRVYLAKLAHELPEDFFPKATIQRRQFRPICCTAARRVRFAEISAGDNAEIADKFFVRPKKICRKSNVPHATRYYDSVKAVHLT
jgi:uncharacterized protein YegL